MVLRTWEKAGRNLSRLGAAPVMLKNGKTLSDPKDEARTAIGYTISHLNCLQVKIELSHGHDCEDEAFNGGLFYMFRAATDARELELALVWYPMTRVDIPKHLWSLHRPALESLMLSDVYLEESLFLDFLLHRGPKLKQIGLKRAMFLPERGQKGQHWWVEFLRVLTSCNGYRIIFIMAGGHFHRNEGNIVDNPLIGGLEATDQCSIDDICHCLTQLLHESTTMFAVSVLLIR